MYLNEKNTTEKKYTIVDNYVKDLGNQGVSIAAMRLIGEGDFSKYKTGINMEELLADTEKNDEGLTNLEVIEKYITEFLRADIITQQPHRTKTKELVAKNNNNWVDGGIYFWRTKEEEVLNEDLFEQMENEITTMPVENKEYVQMSYITPEDFDEEFEKIQQNPTNGSAVEKLKYKFTQDPETDEIIIIKVKTVEKIQNDFNEGLEGIQQTVNYARMYGNSNESNDILPKRYKEYYIEKVNMEYKSMIAKYILPYEFLIQLCEITQNPEFVYHVALLARDTEVVLLIQDNETIDRETVDTLSKFTYYKSYSGPSTPSGGSDGGEEKDRRIQITTVQTPILQKGYADTWNFFEQYGYIKYIETTLEASGPTISYYTPPSTMSGPKYEDNFNPETGVTTQNEYWDLRYATEVDVWKQLKTAEITYSEPIQVGETIEKSKQFLGLLRNSDGKCPEDCYEGKLSRRMNPVALKCAQEAEFVRDGQNVKYRIPNMTKEEAPLNKLLSGLDMLYAVLQSNTSGYDEKDKLMDSTDETYDAQKAYLADEDYKSTYVVKMQGVVEHLKYLFPSKNDKDWPENEEYTKITDWADAVKDFLLKDSDDYIDIELNGDFYEFELTNDDLEILYRICEAEAGGSSEAEIGHVASVILNRVKCSKWPNTIEGVVFQKNQFSPVSDGRFYSVVVSDKTRRAVDSVLSGGDTTGGAFYFRTKASAIKAGMPTSKNETHDTYVYLFTDPNTHIFYTDKTNSIELTAKKQATGKLKDIFPDGLPTTSKEMEQYLVTVEVPITTKKGVKTTKKVRLNKAVADQVVRALQKAQDAGFKVYEVQTYAWRSMTESSKMSVHAYGLAVDINVAENPYVSSTKTVGSSYNPRNNEFSIPAGGALVNAFYAEGWGWGGDWTSKKDYMHFSYNGQ